MRREAGPNKDMAGIGAANSSVQEPRNCCRTPNSGVFHLMGRGPDLSSVSPYCLHYTEYW
jgi:hypothetical protein